MLHESPTETGVSEVLGYILIIGFSLLLSVSIVIGFQGYIGTVSEATTDTNEQRSIVNFNTDVIDVVKESNNISTQVQLQSEESISVDKSTVKLKKVSGGTETTLFNKNYDSLKYETDSNHLIIENNGVWDVQNVNSKLLSDPAVQYQDSKLDLSLITSSNTETISPGFTTITKIGENSSSTSELYNSDKYILEIESPLYKEWGEYMKNKYNTGVQVNYVDAESTTEITLKPSKIYKKSTDSVAEATNNIRITDTSTVSGSVSTTNSVTGKDNISGDVLENRYTEFYPIKDAVSSKISQIKSNSPSEPSPGSGTVTAGQYYVDGDLTLSDTTYDTSSGDIEVAVSGDIKVSGGSEISITGDTGSVEFFVKDDILFDTPSNSATLNPDKDASRFRIFGSGDRIKLSNIQYTGLLYNSPEDKSTNVIDTNKGSLCSQSQTCISSSTVNGSIISGQIYVTNSSTLSFDTSVQSILFDFTNTGTEESFRYNLTEYNVEY